MLPDLAETFEVAEARSCIKQGVVEPYIGRSDLME